MSRHYGQQIRFGPPLTPVVKKLLIANIAIHIGIIILRNISPESVLWIYHHFALIPDRFLFYQGFTYAFLHDSIGHLFWNMIALWIFGSEVEGMWGRRPFWLFYLLCALGGAIGVLLKGDVNIVIGSSGAVLGLVVAYGMLFSERPISLLFPPVTIKAKWIAIGWALIDLLVYLEGARGFAYFAHLGGMLTAFLYIKSPWKFSPSTSMRVGGLSLKDHLRRWKTKRILRVIQDKDKEQEEKEKRGPTFH